MSPLPGLTLPLPHQIVKLLLGAKIGSSTESICNRVPGNCRIRSIWQWPSMQLAVPSWAEPFCIQILGWDWPFQSGRSSCGECFGVTQLHHVDFHWIHGNFMENPQDLQISWRFKEMLQRPASLVGWNLASHALSCTPLQSQGTEARAGKPLKSPVRYWIWMTEASNLFQSCLCSPS